MTREHFILEEIKVLKNNVTIKHKVSDGSDTLERKNIPHPDLQKALNSMKMTLLKSHRLNQNLANDVTITGFSISSRNGDGNTVQMVIKGTLKTASEKVVAVNTESFSTEEETYASHNNLDKIQLVEDEAWEYLFNGKQAQQSMEFPEEHALNEVEEVS